jgi:DNA primase
VPGIDFNLLRQTITMNEILTALHYEPASRTGDQLHGPCPIHQSKSSTSRSLSVNLRLNRYYCHQCQSKGNALEFWAAVRKLSVYDAAIDLCKTLGKETPWINRW